MGAHGHCPRTLQRRARQWRAQQQVVGRRRPSQQLRGQLREVDGHILGFAWIKDHDRGITERSQRIVLQVRQRAARPLLEVHSERSIHLALCRDTPRAGPTVTRTVLVHSAVTSVGIVTPLRTFSCRRHGNGIDVNAQGPVSVIAITLRIRGVTRRSWLVLHQNSINTAGNCELRWDAPGPPADDQFDGGLSVWQGGRGPCSSRARGRVKGWRWVCGLWVVMAISQLHNSTWMPAHVCECRQLLYMFDFFFFFSFLSFFQLFLLLLLF